MALRSMGTVSFILHAKLARSPSSFVCSVTQSCLTLCNPMDCRTPGLPVLHCLPELAQTHVHWASDVIQPSHPLFSSFLQSFLASRSFLMSWPFMSGGQIIGISASASVLPMNIQDWFLLGLTGLVSLQSKWLSRVFTLWTPCHMLINQY